MIFSLLPSSVGAPQMPHEEAKAGLRSQSTGEIQSQVKAVVVESLLSITTSKHTLGKETCLFTAHPTGQNCLKTRNIVSFWEDGVLLISNPKNSKHPGQSGAL